MLRLFIVIISLIPIMSFANSINTSTKTVTCDGYQHTGTGRAVIDCRLVATNDSAPPSSWSGNGYQPPNFSIMTPEGVQQHDINGSVYIPTTSGTYSASYFDQLIEGFSKLCAAWYSYPPTMTNPTEYLDSSYVCVDNIRKPSCSATDVSIDHGDISPSSFDGDISSGSGNVTCKNADATVSLSFSTTSIDLNNGGESNLVFSENGKTSITILANENVITPFVVKSTLAGTPSVTGPFNGSTTLIMSYE
ncbi:hypothetical protein PGN94_22005 [Klebsiella aerogenes]